MQAQSAVKTKHKSVSYSKYGYFFIAPFFIIFLIFQLYPIIFTFRTSVTDTVGWGMLAKNNMSVLDPWWSNFSKLFDPANELYGLFWGSLWNTIVIWFFNFVPQIGFALILASWFTDTHLHLKAQGAFKVMIFMPNIITAATIGMLFFSLFSYPIAPQNRP